MFVADLNFQLRCIQLSVSKKMRSTCRILYTIISNIFIQQNHTTQSYNILTHIPLPLAYTITSLVCIPLALQYIYHYLFSMYIMYTITFHYISGCFLIPYFVCLVAGGIPIFFMEIAMGQFMGRGGHGSWMIAPALHGTIYI